MVANFAFRRPFALLAATVAAAGSLVACVDTPGPTTPLEQAVGVSVDAPRVELIDAGDATSVLSFSDVDNDAHSLDVAISTGIAQNIEDQAALDVTPPPGSAAADQTVTLTLTGQTNEASEATEGQIEATRSPEYVVDHATSTDPSINEELNSVADFRFGWRAIDSGVISTLFFSAPEEANDDARLAVESALMTLIGNLPVFPEEEIGEGASWSVDTRLADDSAMLQTTTYTVTAIEGDEVELDVQVFQRPSIIELSLAGMLGAENLEDESLTVTSSETSSSGTITVDLSRGLPVAGSVDLTTRVVYSGSAAEAIIQDTSTRLEFQELADN